MCAAAVFWSLRFPRLLFTPPASPHARPWKPRPEQGRSKAALSTAASTPLRCTAGPDGPSLCARQTRSCSWPFPQKQPPSRPLCLLLERWDAASAAPWPKTEATGRRRSCPINRLTKARPTAPSAASPTDSSISSSRVPPSSRRAGGEPAGWWSRQLGTGWGRSAGPGPTLHSTRPRCTELPRFTAWGALAKGWMWWMELPYTAPTS